MRKLVKSKLIMLPLLLLSLWQGFLPVTSAYAQQTTNHTTYAPLPLLNSDLLTLTKPLITPCEPKKQLSILIPLVDQPILQREKPVAPSVPEVASIQAALAPESIAFEESQIASPAAVPTTSIVAPTPSAGSSGGLNAEVIFAMVNQERANAGLPPFEHHPDVCGLVQSRAHELENEVNGTSYIHAGFQARHIPFRASENMISQQTEAAAVAWWMHSSVHRSAILGDIKYACVACSGHACAMIFADL